MAHDVFISHSNKDKVTADAICATLERRSVRCWIAPRDVPPGPGYAGAIVKAIRETRIMVLVYSASSNSSRHVLSEVDKAADYDKIIVPFKIEDVTMSDDMAFYLSVPHWLDAITPPVEQHLDRLADSVGELLGVPLDAPAVVEAPAAVEEPPREKSSLGEWMEEEQEKEARQRTVESEQQEKEINELRERLVQQLDAKAFEEARVTLDSLLRLRPEDVEANEAEALLPQLKRRYEERKQEAVKNAQEAEARRQEAERIKNENRLLELRASLICRLNKEIGEESWKAARNTLKEMLRVNPEDAEAADGLTKAERRLRTPGWTKTIFIPDSLESIEFVYVPPGTFVMGSRVRELDSGTQHQVQLTKGYYLGKYPVTQAQWKAVMGERAEFLDQDDQHPVESVTWNDCQQFLQKLNEPCPSTFRLPWEAEWEYACRAGSTAAFCFGGDACAEPFGSPSERDSKQLNEYVWCLGSSSGRSHPVGQKKPNAWGLFDMHGNILEWCQDWKADYSNESVVDPQGPSSGEERVLRGGSWSDGPSFCHSASREGSPPIHHSNTIGFRLLRELD